MAENKEIVVLTGKGAVGKSSLIDYLVENGEQKILKQTTRLPRDDEVNGRDYRFVSQDEFIHDRSMRVCTRIGYNLYGVNQQSLDEQKGRSFVTLDLRGILQLEKAVAPARIRVMMIEAPKSLTYLRQEKSGQDFDSIRVNRRYDEMMFSQKDISKIKSPIFHLDGSLDVPDLAKQMYAELNKYNQQKMVMLSELAGSVLGG